MTTDTKTAEKKIHQPLPPCLCLECRRQDCHGIGKPLSHAAAIKANAKARGGAARCR